MVLELVSRDELARCLGIEAGSGPLPVTARSLTRAEVRAREWRGLRWLLAAFALVGLVVLAVMLLAETSPTVVRWLPIAFGGTAVGLAIYAWLRLRRSQDYLDPATTVEVTDDGITVSGEAGTVTQPFEAVVVSRVIARTPRNSVYFEGILLETELGPVALGDPGFAGGNAAAGAILRRLDELDLPLTRTAA